MNLYNQRDKKHDHPRHHNHQENSYDTVAVRHKCCRSSCRKRKLVSTTTVLLMSLMTIMPKLISGREVLDSREMAEMKNIAAIDEEMLSRVYKGRELIENSTHFDEDGGEHLDEHEDDHEDEHLDEHEGEHLDEHEGEHLDEHEDEHLDEHEDEHLDEHEGEHLDEHEDEHDHEGEHLDEHEDEHHDEHEDEHHDDHDDHDHEEDHDSHDDHDDHDHDEHDHSEFTDTEDSVKEDSTKNIILACFLINLAALTGVAIWVPLLFLKKYFNVTPRMVRTAEIGVSAFAAGTLLATAFFLIIPEALEQIGTHGSEESDGHDDHDDHEDHDDGDDHGHGHDDHEGESGVAWKFGLALSGGYLLPLLLSAVLKNHDHVHDLDDSENQIASGETRREETQTINIPIPESEIETGVELTDVEQQQYPGDNTSDKMSDIVKPSIEPAKRRVNYSLCASILLGDGFHNFADGIFVASAFLLCDTSIAWSIVAVTVFHELTQEVADFFVLMTHGGLRWYTALILNFLSGFSVMFGGLLILYVDMTDFAIGIVLAGSAGVYINIAATECMGRVDKVVRGTCDQILVVLAFAVGVTPIYFVSLNHHHC